MSPTTVGALYDALNDFEARFRESFVYPMHKQLRFPGTAPLNVYDWITGEIAVPGSGRILDAGCGVGFGCLRLAERTSCTITGISLSEREITHARAAIHDAGLEDRVRVEARSFDELPVATYRLVVAVESLKHSRNLARTLGSIRKSLQSGGQLVIVDDLVAADAGRDARSMAADWDLAHAYTEADYLDALAPLDCRVIDLTGFAAVTGTIARAAQRAAIGLTLPFTAARTTAALRAFRGGLYLQTLYARRLAAYKAILCRVPETGS
jgi:SAM-dependent methyltransferase